MLSTKIISTALYLGSVALSLAQNCTTFLPSGNNSTCIDPCTDAEVAWDREGEPALMSAQVPIDQCRRHL
eukprot:7203-Heterococcus_DN1.PRE.1